MTDIPALIEELKLAANYVGEEYERLLDETSEHVNAAVGLAKDNESLRTRIRELEADLAAMKKWALDSDTTNDKLRAERDMDREWMNAVRIACHEATGGNTTFIDDDVSRAVRRLIAERDAIDTELRKIASFIEPHWQGAGAKLEADWIIRAIGQMNSEADDIRTTTLEEILSQIPGGNICDPQVIADRIRALIPQKPETETE
jgi:hypothetical protein